MFVGESLWIRDALAPLPVGEGTRALDAGSSTLHYRTVEQPHVDRNVFAPLRQRGVTITHLDIKEAEGVDVVCDITEPGFAVEKRLGGRFQLVLCCGLLQNVGDVRRTVEAVTELVAPGGYLLVTTPQRYRRTLDPRDSMIRPRPAELAAMFSGDGSFGIERAGSVRIDQISYYKGLLSRLTWIPVGQRWVPLPGFVERLRYRIKPLRWRESCVLLRCSG